MFDPDSYDVHSEFQRQVSSELIPYLVSQMSWDEIEGDKNKKYKIFEHEKTGVKDMRKLQHLANEISEMKKLQTEAFEENSLEDEEINILDFGCGSGFTTKKILLPAFENLLFEKKFKIYGIDISEKMIDFASENHSGPNISYLARDILKEEIELPQKFTKIFSFFTLHWIKDQRKVLEKFYEILNVGGELGIFFVSNCSPFRVYEDMSKMITWKQFTHDVKNFIPKSFYSLDPAGDMRKLLNEIGYIVQEVSIIKKGIAFDSIDLLMSAAMAINPFFHRIPVEMREAYVKDFQKSYEPNVKFLPNNKGVEAYSMVMLIRAYKPKY